METSKVTPLFSLVWCTPSGIEATRKGITTLQAQSFGEFELIVACDAFDRESCALIRAAAEMDARIKLLHTTANSPGERLLLALRQCHGRYIAICPTNGTFQPDVWEFVANEFQRDPSTGGLCCSDFLVDFSGRTMPDVDIVTLLLSSYRPYLPAGFLDRDALVASGLNDDNWLTDSIELEIWSKIATDFGIRSVVRKVVDGGQPQLEITASPSTRECGISARLALVNKLFSSDGFFGHATPALLLESKINQLAILRGQLDVLGFARFEAVVTSYLQKTVDELRTLLATDHRVLQTLHRLAVDRTSALGLLSGPLRAFLALLKRRNGRWAVHAGYTLWNFPLIGSWLTRTMFVKSRRSPEPDRAADRKEMYADIYGMVGGLYDSRGQITQALAMWERARQPNDIAIDSLACQALLKVPNITDAALVDQQRKWIAPHISGLQAVASTSRTDPRKRIRVGYHCAFMNGDTIRFIMRGAIAAHDRSRFEIFGYSPQRSIDGRTPPFDTFRHTPPWDELVGDPPSVGGRLGDPAFVDLVRNDHLDIFVELTGFTPGHRFAAMGQRLAPIQISYLNHLGSSQVPNVDYIFSDNIATPVATNCQQYYSEDIYRLRDCFLCYDYTSSNEPPVVDPPCAANSFVTFGYFGSGSKLNIQVIELWSKLLNRVHNSKLHIQNLQLSSPANRRFLIDRFQRFGISPERLVVGGGMDRPALMERYGCVDISLDTWPYCGGNTIAESLWQGVPVITCKGDRFVSAYGASLLAAVGCPELVAETPTQYVEMAAQLAHNPSRLMFLRHNLRRMAVENGLADSTGFARRLEIAYTDMLARFRDRDTVGLHGKLTGHPLAVAP